jgi:hypothetical protein
VRVRVATGDRYRVGIRGDRGLATDLAVFEHQHFLRLAAVFLGREQIHVGGRLAVLDFVARYCEDKAISKRSLREHTIEKHAAAARGNGFGDAYFIEGSEKFQQARHGAKPRDHELVDHLHRLGGECVDGVGQVVPVDHDLQGFCRLATHHFVEQFGGKFAAPAGKYRAADFLIKFLGVEHQAVEVKDDGFQWQGRRLIILHRHDRTRTENYLNHQDAKFAKEQMQHNRKKNIINLFG